MGAAVWLRQALLPGVAALLLGCGAAPVQPPWRVAPLLRVDHAGGDEAAALYRVGRYHQQRGELPAAAEAFARSIALQPDQLDARNAQAVLLAGQGRQAEAIALLEQVVAAYPREAQPMNNLGYLYYLQGRQQKARTALAQALRLDPQHAQARANLARLAPGSAMPGAATPGNIAAAPEVAAADTAAPSRLQLVQLAPNEFRLQERLAPAPVVAQAATAAAAMKTTAATKTAVATTITTAAATATVTPAAVPAVTSDADSGGAALQIVNGNGVPGLGERTRRLLARVDRLDAASADVVNKRRRDQRTTIIEYLPGQQERARLMQAALPGPALLLPARALPDGLGLRLVLGRDHAEAGAKPRTARASGPARTTPSTRLAGQTRLHGAMRATRPATATRPTLLTDANPPPRWPSAALLTMNSTAVPHFNQE